MRKVVPCLLQPGENKKMMPKNNHFFTRAPRKPDLAKTNYAAFAALVRIFSLTRAAFPTRPRK